MKTLPAGLVGKVEKWSMRTPEKFVHPQFIQVSQLIFA